MKLKINKACDLNSISVLPPQSRRLSGMPAGPPASQLRSQLSQQSLSSQHGIFSQHSQTSLDEALSADQRFNSQDRENFVKKPSGLLPTSYGREECQMPISISSSTLMRKWNSASVPDHRCQLNEELEHRIGLMETSVNKLAMVLDSVQSDVMQVNKGTKEVSLEMEGLRQKLIALETSLQLMNKTQEDVKGSLDQSLKSISEQLSKDIYQDKLQQIFLVLSALPEQMQASLLRLQNELRLTFTKEMQALACSLKTSKTKSPSITVLPVKVTGDQASSRIKPKPAKNPAVPQKVCGKANHVPKVEMGGWNSVKVQQTKFTNGASRKQQKFKRVSPVQKFVMQEKQIRVIDESDAEIDEGFSCLIDKKETGNHTIDDDAEEESKRILRRARRRRKYCNPIIVD